MKVTHRGAELRTITALFALVMFGSTQARGEEAPRGLASLAALRADVGP